MTALVTNSGERGGLSNFPAASLGVDLLRAGAETACVTLRSDDGSLFQALPEAAFIIERDTGQILAANPAAASLHGYTPDELIDRRAAELCAEPLETKGARPHKRRDGTTFQGEATVSSIEWNGRGAFVVLIRDVTERQKMEDALKESRALLSNAFNRNPLLMSVADLSTDRYLEVNDAFCARSGFTREEMIGKTAIELGMITEQERDSLAQRLFAAPKNSAIELTIRTRNGTLLSCRYWGEVVQSSEGLKLFAAAEDATEQKKLEARLAQADRLASMGMLAAGLAHEVNNPLAYVLGNLEALSQALPKLVDEVKRHEALHGGAQLLEPALLDGVLDAVRDALEGSLRIKKISRSLDTFARAEQVSLESVDVNRALEAALSMAHNEVKHRAQLVKELGPLPPVLASDGKLAQVFLNVLINAAQAIPEGKVEENRITVRSWTEGAHVLADISDTGPGMSPAILSRVFEPFFTTKKLGQGSGLGLAISKNIITEFGGELRIESAPGQGTRVIVKLPASPQAATEARPGAEQQPREANVRGRILLVDDEAPILRVLTRLLGEHETVTAASGREAKALLEKDSAFDVIFCDLMMPDLTGMDLHAWLAATNPVLASRVVFISGGAFTPHAAAYLASVPNLKLDKPLQPARIKELAAEFVLAARGHQRP